MVKITPLQSNKGQFAFNTSNHCSTTLNYLLHEVPLDVLQQFAQCFFLLNLLLTFLNISLLFSKINWQTNDQYDNAHFLVCAFYVWDPVVLTGVFFSNVCSKFAR